MCGIAAIFAYQADSPKVRPDELRSIRNAMARRGPDGSGEWFSSDGKIALGHRRLSILDLSQNGAQPMASADQRFIISFNGEIYNYKEIRASLQKKGYTFKSASDTETLLYLYQEKGESMLSDLRGMFAFSIWDEKEKKLFLARDPFGIKPLYYIDDGRIFRAASQVKALLKSHSIDTSFSAAGHAGFFLWGFVPEPHTLYKNIHALPAGHFMMVGYGGPKTPQKYFSFRDEYLKVANQSEILSENQKKEILRQSLLDSVQHHLISDVPVGLFLSSGIDSTVLTALASETKPNLKAITVVFDEYEGTENDESGLAQLVARQYGIDHQKILITKEMFHARLDEYFQSMDQPTTDGLNTFFISQAAASTGLKVALSGLGGDELFSGYPSFQDVPKSARYFSWARQIPMMGKFFRQISSPLLSRFSSPKLAGALEYGATFEGAYLLRRALFMPWELYQFLDHDLVRDGLRALDTTSALRRTFSGVSSEHLRVSFLEMEWYMRSQLLRDVDWASMHHSLEIRVPFLDKNFFDAALPLMSQKNPPVKNDLASVPAQALPKNVLERRKTGFVTPVNLWIEEMMGQKIMKPERGLRGWAKLVYDRF